MSFSVGDTVYLKGFDQLMMVHNSTGNVVECLWFDGSGNLKGYCFGEDVLTKEPPSPVMPSISSPMSAKSANVQDSTKHDIHEGG